MANFKGVPTPLIRRQGIDPKAKTGALRGEVCLKFKDALTGKVTEEFRGHNMLTNGLESAMNGCPFDLNKLDGSNINNMQSYKYTPIYEKLLGGLILFPQALGNDANLLFPSFANSPTGYASCDSYQQGDPKQGSYDAVTSGIVTNGFRHVFLWGSAFGNGTISSLGLAPKYCEGWCSDINKRFMPSTSMNDGYTSYIEYGAPIVGISDKGFLIVAPEAENNNRISLLAFYGNHRAHDISLMQRMDGTAVDMSNQYSNDHRDGYTWAIHVPNLPANENLDSYWRKYSFQIIGNYVYVIFHASTQTFKVTRLSLSDGSVVEENSYTFDAPIGDSVPVYYDGYIYFGSSSAGTIYKGSCATGQIVGEITNSIIPANAMLRFTGGQWIYNQYFILDADSDIIVANTGSANPVAYQESDIGSPVPMFDNGMWIVSRGYNRGNRYLVANMKQWGLITHYDLAEPVQKTIDKQMEVYYTITQV